MVSVLYFIFITDFPDYPARHTRCNHTGRYIAFYNTARTYNRIITDYRAGKNGYACAKPDIIAYFYRPCNFNPHFPLLRIHCVFRCCKTAIRCNQHMIAKGYAYTIRYNKIVV